MNEDALIGDKATAESLSRLLRLKLVGAGGIEVRPSPDGSTWTIALRQRNPERGGVEERQLRAAKILGGIAINGAVRYRYSIEFGHFDMSSNPSNGGTWVTDDNNDSEGYTAFSEVEDMNTSTGATLSIGTGNTNVNRTTGAVNGTSCLLKPLPQNGYCTVRERGVGPDGTMYYTIVGISNSAQ